MGHKQIFLLFYIIFFYYLICIGLTSPMPWLSCVRCMRTNSISSSSQSSLPPNSIRSSMTSDQIQRPSLLARLRERILQWGRRNNSHEEDEHHLPSVGMTSGSDTSSTQTPRTRPYDFDHTFLNENVESPPQDSRTEVIYPGSPPIIKYKDPHPR